MSSLIAAAARGDWFDEYTLVETFTLPDGADVFDVLPDGRIILLVDAAVHVETRMRSREFVLRGTLQGVAEMPYPAFVRVSPGGERFAVGDNSAPGSVGVFNVETLSGVWLAASHFDAEWYDETHLAISGANANAVTLLDTASSDPLHPTNPVIIEDTGFAGGVTFDSMANLYTGNGYGNGPVYTGELRAFEHGRWTGVLSGGAPLDFLTDGTLIVDILSAASLGFDSEGNMHVGGGDFLSGTDIDFAALVRASAVGRALAGLGPADPVDPHFVRRIDPDPDNDSNSYSVTYSVAANELYLRSFGDDVVYTYAAASTGGDPWADAVVDAHPTLDGAGLYTDPQSVLGMPTTTFYDPLVSEQFHVSLVAAPFNLDSPNGQKVVTTINSGQFIKVRFDEPVQDDPRNPFGIDLIVFGNSFFIGNGFPGPTTDMAAHILTGDVFSESVTVAVSPTGLGTPQSHPDHWYVYTNGPFADALYPSNAYEWDRQLNDWDSQLDFATPVDPSLAVEEFAGGSVADGIDLYECSGGGTGFDLAESGFSSISYVYLTGVGGEVDALSDVFPSLGDFDRDGDVDLRDVASFQNCFHAGFTGLETCACRSGDFDGNRVVDLEDYAAVASFFEGPS